MLPPIEYIPDSAIDASLDAQLRALLSICFTGPHNERFATQRFFDKMPQHRWIMRESGRVVAHVAFHEKTIGTPSGEYQIAGVAEVAIHPDYRKMGLAKRLVAVGMDFFAARDVPFAFLFGRRELYASSGFFPVTNPLRIFDPSTDRWVVGPVESAQAKLLGNTSWPDGEIDLRGAKF